MLKSTMPNHLVILNKVKNLAKRSFPLLLFLFLLLPLVKLTPSLLASTNLDDYAQIIGENQEDPSLEGLESSSLNNTIFKLNILLTGNPHDPENQPGALKSVSTYIAAVYQHPPASFQTYYADLKGNFLGKPAYAQGGIGFTGLQPILPIWKAFRNITYSLSAIIFVILGIMIMFRVKISPQAVLTIQAAIPKVVTTLILITFSYAIAGLIIDLSYLLVALTLTTLQASGLSIGGQTIADLTQAGFMDMFQLMFRALPMAALTLIPMVIGAIIGGVVGTGLGGPGIGTAAGALLGIPAGYALFSLIFLVILLFWLIKFFFGLIKCYLQIILKIILAPFEIGTGAFPGQVGGFSNWLKGLIANLAVFPLSLLFMVIVNAIIESTQSASAIWAPSLIAGGDLDRNPILYMVSGGFVPVAIGLGAVMMLSKLPELIPQAIFQIKPSPFGAAIGETKIPAPIQNTAFSTVGKTFYDPSKKKPVKGTLVGGAIAGKIPFSEPMSKFIGETLQSRAKPR